MRVLCKLKMCSLTCLHIFSQSVHISLVFEMRAEQMVFTETIGLCRLWLQHSKDYHINIYTKYDITSLYAIKSADFSKYFCTD